MQKALFAFRDDLVVFVHVLKNALDMNEKGWTVKVILEGSATGLLPKLADPEDSLHKIWEQAKKAGLIAGVCKACSMKMGTLEEASRQKLIPLQSMGGHPSMADFMDEGFEILVF